MKFPSHWPVQPANVTRITNTIERALASAGLETQTGPLRDVTETIRRALASSSLPGPATSPAAEQPYIDVDAQVVSDLHDTDTHHPRLPDVAEPKAPGAFMAREFSNQAGTRAYKVYIPARPLASPPPVVVMLHGCTQSADDFAAGTRMNRWADEHGFLVVYPEQAPGANPSRCWNWFMAQDQVRNSGEPSLIAGIVRDVVARHGADPRRVFVAGLSAGAAMAVVLGQTYPELFAAVGAHSGLAYGSAHDIPSALAAMKAGRGRAAHLQNLSGATTAPHRKARHAVPTIVFHGDRDSTVQHTNGVQIVQQASDAHVDESGTPLQTHIERGTAAGGRSYSKTVYVDADARVRMESWTLHGAGHAWSGGDASGSYTDNKGPDASAEMVRFFLAQPCAASA